MTIEATNHPRPIAAIIDAKRQGEPIAASEWRAIFQELGDVDDATTIGSVRERLAHLTPQAFPADGKSTIGAALEYVANLLRALPAEAIADPPRYVRQQYVIVAGAPTVLPSPSARRCWLATCPR
ncbi:MAG: hypothetical protein ACYC35_01640 [Pirellulales bacterium]